MTVDASTAGLAACSVLVVVATALPLRPSAHRAVTSASERAPARDAASRFAQWWHRIERRVGGAGRHSTTAQPAAIAEWCDDLSRRLRAGASLREALRQALPLDAAARQLTTPIRRAIERGVPTEEAVRRVSGGGPDLELAAAVLATAARLGGSPAAAIDRTAAVLRQRSADRGERLVQSAQARLSAHVLTVLPVAILGVLLLADGDVRLALTEPVGAACVAAGLALNTVGWCWMRRVVTG